MAVELDEFRAFLRHFYLLRWCYPTQSIHCSERIPEIKVPLHPSLSAFGSRLLFLLLPGAGLLCLSLLHSFAFFWLSPPASRRRRVLGFGWLVAFLPSFFQIPTQREIVRVHHPNPSPSPANKEDQRQRQWARHKGRGEEKKGRLLLLLLLPRIPRSEKRGQARARSGPARLGLPDLPPWGGRCWRAPRLIPLPWWCGESSVCVPMAREEEGDEFFDSREVMSPASVFSSPGSSGRHDEGADDCGGGALLEVWVSGPCSSVHERRQRFIRSLGLLDPGARPDEMPCSRPSAAAADEEVEIVLGSPAAELVSAAVTGSADRDEEPGVPADDRAGEVLECVFKNLDDGTVFVVDEVGQDGSFRSLRERRSNRTVTAAEFERISGSSPFIRELMRRVDDSDEPSSPEKSAVRGKRRRRRFGWLRRLGIGACVVDMEEDDEMNSTSSSSSRSCSGKSGKVDRVKVRPYKKRSKELSAVYRGQEIKAHKGAIVAMKFSYDGQYLATGGEDGAVRVWRVVEGERPDGLDFAEDDPSCVFFTVNENSELAPVNSSEGTKTKQNKSSKGTADPACVVIPHRTFAISQVPVHEFYGHDDVILDLSWSKNGVLLSASMDKTVRLWQVGCNSCLKVFSHNNYVTCVQFQPTSDNYFISGSIDGMVRIWDVRRRLVVDWANSKEIVTAVCYRPDGKGAVVGTITGNCRYYDASENHLELESQVSLNGRKKSPLKRIIGLQYCPSDPKKLMVTSGDSQVRILDGVHVISNYKGLRSSSQGSASFTPDGDHIISASDDSSIYMWNYANQINPITNRVKTVWSYERFFCNDVSIAIPWNALRSRNSISLACNIPSSRQEVSDDFHNIQDSTSRYPAEDSLDSDNLYHLPSGNFTLSNAFFAESAPRGSATWPEEQLPSNSATTSTLRKSQYKFLKASCQNAATHAWGQVIVTGSWDGHIRSFQNYGLPVQV